MPHDCCPLSVLEAGTNQKGYITLAVSGSLEQVGIKEASQHRHCVPQRKSHKLLHLSWRMRVPQTFKSGNFSWFYAQCLCSVTCYYRKCI